MRNILLIKTSSLGDVIHNLPVATDLAAHFPGVNIDWVVEENFADIPALHPGVRRVIPIAMRRWRKNLLQKNTWREIEQFKKNLRQENYDAVLDTQGLIKSALITRWARGAKYGFDFFSVREPLASLVYDKKYTVNKQLHAVERNRRLAEQAIDYNQFFSINYGIAALPLNASWLAQGKYAVLLHATSRADKEWPEARWIELGKKLHGRRIFSVLPWGSEAEKVRAESLAAAIPDAIAPPQLSIKDAASLIAGAEIIIGVDTGLTHLAAALNKPVVAVFCATSPGLTGVYGNTNAINLGEAGRAPSVDQVWSAIYSAIA
ncbi:MAG: lipopolysaccharide heptosyltransferase I [Burkholderiales bacterium]